MNLDVFDRAAQISGGSLNHLSVRIDSQIEAVHQRHQQRLKKLREQQAKEQQQINELLKGK